MYHGNDEFVAVIIVLFYWGFTMFKTSVNVLEYVLLNYTDVECSTQFCFSHKPYHFCCMKFYSALTVCVILYEKQLPLHWTLILAILQERTLCVLSIQYQNSTFWTSPNLCPLPFFYCNVSQLSVPDKSLFLSLHAERNHLQENNLPCWRKEGKCPASKWRPVTIV